MTAAFRASAVRRARARCSPAKMNGRAVGGGNAAIHASVVCIRAARWRWHARPSSRGSMLREAVKGTWNVCTEDLRVNYFPAFFDLNGQKVLIVGGGEVALRKISLLERTGASIIVVAPKIAPQIRARAEAGRLTLVVREFAAEDLDGARLVIVATSRRGVNRWIAKLSESRNIPVNVVDDREASRFIVPAIMDLDPVMVVFSTGGTSPVLARRLRERLEAMIPKRIGELASWLRALRASTRRKLRDTDERRRFFEAIVDGPAARRFTEGDGQGASRIAQQLLAASSTAPPAAGEVTLVGAGPGDPELLTLKALRALQDADVILYDRLVPAAILH